MMEPGYLSEFVRDVPDYPTEGVVYKDLTPLLGNGEAFRKAVASLTSPFTRSGIDKVVGIEARGFILAAPVALSLGAGFVPVRKANKLPWNRRGRTYSLEYGTDTLEMHVDGVNPGERVLIIDDVLATGGTARAAVELVQEVGGDVVGVSVVIELRFLEGRSRLTGCRVHSLLEYA